MKPLIMGNGLLGAELQKQTGWDMISRKDYGIDITDPMSYLFLAAKYDTIINCIAYTGTYCASKEPAWSVNYLAVMDLVDECNKGNKKLIHISTDYVYSHSMRFASEDDVPAHLNTWYGYTKLLADAYIQARAEDYLLIRTSFKPRPFPWDKAWVDLKGNFDYVDVITAKIIDLIRDGATGVYNVGTEFKSMHALAIQTKPDCEEAWHESEPFDVSMNLDKYNNRKWL
jgi:dTDP-4-dehydrorhamnose reductase